MLLFWDYNIEERIFILGYFMRRERVRFTSVHCRKKLPSIFPPNYRFSLSPSPCNFLLFLQCFQRPWKIRILQKFSLCEEEETRGINSGLTRVDGNPEESHWRCSHPTYLACVCVCGARTRKSRTGRGNGGFVTKAVWFNWSHPLVVATCLFVASIVAPFSPTIFFLFIFSCIDSFFRRKFERSKRFTSL